MLLRSGHSGSDAVADYVQGHGVAAATATANANANDADARPPPRLLSLGLLADRRYLVRATTANWSAGAGASSMLTSSSNAVTAEHMPRIRVYQCQNLIFTKRKQEVDRGLGMLMELFNEASGAYKNYVPLILAMSQALITAALPLWMAPH